MIVYVLNQVWDDGDGYKQATIGVFSTQQGADDAKAANERNLAEVKAKSGKYQYDDEWFEIQELTLDEVAIAKPQMCRAD